MKETCSCNAVFEIADTRPWTTAALAEQFTSWRENHRHEFAPVELMPEEPPTIVESGSSHERLGDEYPIQDRALIGFQRNEVR